MTQIDKITEELYKKIPKNSLTAAIAAFVCGLITHSFMIFNKITYYDDVHLTFSLGGTFKNGRWLLGLIGYADKLLWGNEYGIPTIKGLLAIALIAAAAAVLVDVLEVKSSTSIILIACLMEVFPCVTVSLRYNYCAYVYFLALLMAVITAKLVDKGKWGYIVACMTGICVFAIYQAYIAVVCVLYVLLMMKMAIDGEDIKTMGIKAAKWLSSLVVTLVVYFIATKCFCLVTREKMTDYQGLSSMNKGLGSKIFHGFGEAYRNYLSLFVKDYEGVNFNQSIRIFIIFVVLIAVALIIMAAVNAKKAANKIAIAVLGACMPLAINAIYFMVSHDNGGFIHGVMIYSVVFVFIIPIVMLEYVNKIEAAKALICKCKLEYIAAILTLAVIIYYGVYDNAAYLKAEMLQSQMNSYFTTFITQVKEAEGYNPDYDVVLVQNKNRECRYDFNDSSLYSDDELKAITLTCYTGVIDDTITDYSMPSFLKYRCGYDADKILDYYEGIEEGTLETIEGVEDMPCYPNDGSIKVIGNRVVIKLSENE